MPRRVAPTHKPTQPTDAVPIARAQDDHVASPMLAYSAPTQHSVLQMQRTVGNRATQQRLRTIQRPPAAIQRTYLNQNDAYAAVQAAVLGADFSTKESRAVNIILEAVEKYQQQESQKFVDLSAAYEVLHRLEQTVNAQLGTGDIVVAQEIMQGVLDEVREVKADFEWLTDQKKRMTSWLWFPDAEDLGQMRRQILERKSKYTVGSGATYYKSINFHLEGANDQVMIMIRKYMNDKKITQEAFEYGDRKGQLKGETAVMVRNFHLISDFLADKSLVLNHLRPLAAHIKELTAHLDTSEDPKVVRDAYIKAIKVALGAKEKEAGFSEHPLIPLGILPADVFVGLLSSGNVLDDYGAGLQHGELSHRIQWYAIIDAFGTDLKTSATPIDMYKAMNSAPFNAGRMGNTMWGHVLDAGTRADQTTYSAPGTLNRDLLESTGEVDPTDVGLANRRAEYVMPDVSGMEPIGYALSALRHLRIAQAEHYGSREALEGRQWKQFGTPIPEVADTIGGQWASSDEFEEHSSGVSEGKAWKVLKPAEEEGKGKEKI